MDGLGYPLVLELTGGQVHDGVMMQNCLEQLDISGSTVLADKAYGSWENREYIANHDADFCIPPKSNSVDPWYTDFYYYKEGHLVECFFMKSKIIAESLCASKSSLADSSLSFIGGYTALACIISPADDFGNTP